MEKSLWIGLIGIMPKPGNECFGGAQGAYVNVVTFATSAQSFKRKVKLALCDMDMILVEFDPPEQLRDRLLGKNVDKEIFRMAETAKKQDSVVFGTFHMYNSEGRTFEK
jgi:hypothetical protein